MPQALHHRCFSLLRGRLMPPWKESGIAFSNGAALITSVRRGCTGGTRVFMKLTDLGVTFFSCVPTFLAMLEQDIPTVRTLVLGGEVCPALVSLTGSGPAGRFPNANS